MAGGLIEWPLLMIPDHPLEDDYCDVLTKAASARGYSAQELAQWTGIDQPSVEAALAGHDSSPDVLRMLSSSLGLDGGRVIAIARGDYHPCAVLPRDVVQVSMDFHGQPVHCYVVADPQSPGHVIAIDSGTHAEPLLEALDQMGADLKAVFITHLDRDHVGGVDGVLEKFPSAELWSPEGEGFAPGRHFSVGDTFAFGGLTVTALSTRGHGPAAVSFAIGGLSSPVVMVGDSLFAGSIGRPRHGIDLALDEIKNNLLTLDGRTVLCPGHGSLTTVDQELAGNPFFSNDSGVSPGV